MISTTESNDGSVAGPAPDFARRPGAAVAFWAGVLGLVLGGSLLLGWLLGPESVRSWISWRMKTNTALCLTLASSALMLLAREPSRERRRVAFALVGVVTAVGVLTLAQYLFGVDLGIDQLLVRDVPRPEVAEHPNRMSPTAALTFALLGGALFSITSSNPHRALAGHICALAVIALGLLALVGYLYDASLFYQPTRFIRVSPYTAAGAGIVAVGVVALRPDLGLARLMISRGSGGYLTRPLILLAIAAPILFGWLRIAGESLGHYDGRTGTSIMVLLTMGTFVSVVTALGRSLERVDERRHEAETQLRRSAALTAALARAATVNEVVEVTIRLGLPALGASSGGVLLTSEDGAELRMASAQGYSPAVLAHYQAIPISANLPGAEALRTGQPIFIESRAEYVRRYPDVPGDRIANHSSWAALPVQGRDRPLAVLALSFRDPQSFRPAERERVAGLAFQCGQALERAQLYESEKQARERAQSARESAEGANRAKDEFLAMLGHELRNPLSPMLTALQLMKMRANETHRKERDIIERQLQHMVRLVDDLLDVSRITRGKVELKRQRVGLSEIVAKAVEVASPLFEQRLHRLTTDVPMGLSVTGDEHRLTQVLSNLLTNAAKYTEPGGTIAITASPTDDGQVAIKVADSGVGISAELLPRVFDLFVQGYRTPDRSVGGLGLGLAIVRMLVEMHGGRVDVDSEGLGKGSTFTVYLPLEAGAQVQPGAGGASVTGELTAIDPAAHARRILVVDDNRDAAELLADALTMDGHQVRVAFDGPGALAVITEFQPVIAFLDIGLPVMDGHELARRLRAALPGPLTLVAITGYGQAADRARSAEAGFDEHLVKPIDLDVARALADDPERDRSAPDAAGAADAAS